VDNSGNVLGGVFSLYGTIPELGLTNWTLLATGKLVDAYYGALIYDPPSGSTSFTGANALIGLDYVVSPLSALGSVLVWAPFATTGWGPLGDPWTTSVAQYGQFSGSAYYFFDRKTFSVPEPSTLALAGVGLLALAAVARRRKVAVVAS
jgi:hypothetical protein